MTTCNDPGLTSAVNYGNGLIQFTQKSFCSNGVCNDVTVCQVLTSSGEENYYIPVDGTLNESKEMVILFFVHFQRVITGALLYGPYNMGCLTP